MPGGTVVASVREVRVEGMFAEGGMARVSCRARDVSGGAAVALKQCLFPADASDDECKADRARGCALGDLKRGEPRGRARAACDGGPLVAPSRARRRGWGRLAVVTRESFGPCRSTPRGAWRLRAPEAEALAVFAKATQRG